MFSQASVCGQEGGGSHVTVIHDALDLTVQGPPDTKHGTYPPPPTQIVKHGKN